MSAKPLPVEESVPVEEKIEWAVQSMGDNHYIGPYGMRAEHLRGWFREARKAEEVATERGGDTEGGTAKVAEAKMEATEMMDTATAEMSHWQKVVVLLQTDFQERQLAE